MNEAARHDGIWSYCVTEDMALMGCVEKWNSQSRPIRYVVGLIDDDDNGDDDYGYY